MEKKFKWLDCYVPFAGFGGVWDGLVRKRRGPVDRRPECVAQGLVKLGTEPCIWGRRFLLPQMGSLDRGNEAVIGQMAGTGGGVMIPTVRTLLHSWPMIEWEDILQRTFLPVPLFFSFNPIPSFDFIHIVETN
ncbi:hypothetical protein TWF569_005200 [Orbilia oligospora]|nr:hypothetical protein TWF594_007891 [Orbilia oligospora]KAF3149126.1 hypothetical protein TWF569_005200 [Orbilia oligospora]